MNSIAMVISPLAKYDWKYLQRNKGSYRKNFTSHIRRFQVQCVELK